MKEIKEYMTFKEIQEIGGFEALTKLGYGYSQLYHEVSRGEFEGHNLYQIYKI